MLKIDSSLIKELKKIPLNDKDFDELETIRGNFSKLLSERKEKYLNAEEFEQIICWKLDTQANRSKQQRKINVDGLVIPITKAYFNIVHFPFFNRASLQGCCSPSNKPAHNQITATISSK